MQINNVRRFSACEKNDEQAKPCKKHEMTSHPRIKTQLTQTTDKQFAISNQLIFLSILSQSH